MTPAAADRRDAAEAARTLLAWIVAGVFIIAAADKIADPGGFAQSIKYYKLVPQWAIHAQALLLPWWELAAALALLSRPWRRAGAWLVLFMLGVFLAATSTAVARGLDISCGCFGKASGKVGAKTIALDVVLIVITGVILWLRRRPELDEPVAGL